MPRVPRPELAPFLELNEQEKVQGKKTPWKERYALIQEHFPRAVRYDWRTSLRDTDLWARIWRDIYEADLRAGDGGLVEDNKKSRERLRQLMGADFSLEPFNVAFKALIGSRSVRHVATKCGLTPNMVFRLQQGERKVDLDIIEKVAKGFGKDPSYFMEYRIAYVMGALGDQLEMLPEASVDLYRKLQKKAA